MLLPLKISITLFLLVLAIVTKMAEAAIFAASESELEATAEKGKKNAKRVLKIRQASKRTHPALRTALTATQFQMTAFASVFFYGELALPIAKLGVPVFGAELLGALIIALCSAFVTVFFVALFARHLAIKHNLGVAMGLSCFATVIYTIYTPLSALVEIMTNLIFAPMGINASKQDVNVSEETIKMMVDAGSEQGTIDSEEKEFIENVFAFDDLTANDVATHRTEITILWTDETAQEWEATIYKSHHTYFPICDEKIDNVIGVLSAKDYFRLKDRSKESVMAYAVSTPYFIPMSMKANAILQSMKQKRTYFAIVIDEYGGLNGIVTVTDLLECIVGDIFDDPDAKKLPEIEPLDSKNWMIRGCAPIEDVEKTLKITLGDDYDTFAGYVLTMVESIPDDGVVFTVENDLMTVKITAVKDRRIEKTMVQLKEQPIEE